MKPNNTLDARRPSQHHSSVPPRTKADGRTLNVSQILQNHNNSTKKAQSSVSKISLLANKLDKIKMYN